MDLFSGLAEEEVEALAALGKEETFRKGQVLFHEGEEVGRLWVVVLGVVEVSRSGERGEPPLRLERGDLLGELGCFGGAPWPGTATAAVVPETRLLSWDFPSFQAFLSSRPRAGVAILDALARKMGARLREASEAARLLARAFGR